RMRVYPPARSVYQGAMVVNSFAVIAGFMTKRATCRRAARSPCLPNVIIRSARRRASLALATVVSMRSYSNSAVMRFRRTARRCDDVRLSLRWSFLWRMSVLRARERAGLAHVAAHVHPEMEPHLAQDALDRLHGLSAEVAVL